MPMYIDKMKKACKSMQAILLTCQGSNLDSPDPESGVLPVTPQVNIFRATKLKYLDQNGMVFFEKSSVDY